MAVTSVELVNNGEKMDVVYFGAFRRQTVKNPQNCSVRTRWGRNEKNSGGNKFWTSAPNIFGPSVWNLFHVTRLATGIVRLLLIFFFSEYLCIPALMYPFILIT